jgi:hypothetical protein
VTTQALERTQPAKVGVITTPSEFRGSLAGWREKRFHVLTPAADFTALPPQWGLLPVKVQIDQDEQTGEVYQDKLFCKDHEVSLTKIGLTKIAQAAGMSIKTERMDNRMIANYWEVRATIRLVGLDGTPQEWSATEELDLRDGSERSKKVMGREGKMGALIASRAKGMRNCEARAINAAIRLYGVKQKYTRDELNSPFIVVRMLFQPNMADPTQAAIATHMAMGGVNALYSPSPMAALPAAELDVIDGTAQPAMRQVDSPAAKPEPQQSAAVLVEQVTNDMDTGLYTVRLAGGLEVVTDQAEVARVAQQAKKTRQGVLVETETRNGRVVITELQVVKTGESRAQNPEPSRQSANAPASMPDGSTTIAEVKREKGTNAKTQRPWVRYDVTFTTGEIASTFSESMQQLINDAEKQKARVRITTTEQEGYNDKLESFEIVDRRQQSLPDPGDL